MTGEQLAKIHDLIYTGPQEVYQGPDVYLFTDRATRGTFAVRKLDTESVTNGLNDLRKRFNVRGKK